MVSLNHRIQCLALGIYWYYLGEHELKVHGSMMYRHEDYETAVEMIAAGKIVPDPLLSRTFPFEESREAYRFIDEQGDKIMKVMIGLE